MRMVDCCSARMAGLKLEPGILLAVQPRASCLVFLSPEFFICK